MKIFKNICVFILFFLGSLFLSGCKNKTVSITFDVTGGSSVNDINEIDLKETIILPISEKDNFKFIGWYLEDKEMTSELIVEYFTVNKDLITINLTAKWEKEKYNVKFYDNGILLKEEVVKYNESATAPKIIEKTGFNFIKWDLDFSNVKEDLNVTAIWENKIFNIKYSDYDGTILKEIKAEYNQDLNNIIAPLVNRNGYKFLGWSQKLPANMPSEDIVLIANYSVNKYNIFFIENGGSEVTDINQEFGTEVNKPTDPIKEGYKFLGWYLQQEFIELYEFSIMSYVDVTLYAKWEVEIYKIILLDDDLQVLDELQIEYNCNLDLISLPLVKKNGYTFIKWSKELPNKMPNSDIVLIAEYKINQYVISFEVNGGSIINPIIQDFKSPVSRPINPLKVGYVFEGWYLEENLLNLYIFTTMPSENIVLYAKWVQDDSILNEFENYITNKLASEIETDIILPTNYKDLIISWTSNNEEVLSSKGKYTRPYQIKEINLTANFVHNNTTHSIIFVVNVKGYKVLQPGIASSYIYRQYNNVTDDYFEILDIINCAFINANSSATLTGSAYLNNVSNYIIPKAKENGVWVVMSIAPESSWSTIAASPALVNTFANNIVSIINQYGFDGVDLDWETPTSSQSESFVALAKKVNEKVKANNPNHLVTAAIGGGMWQPPKYNLKDSHQYLDYINMMTYGMVSNNGYYQNALFPSKNYDNAENNVGKTLGSCSISESVAIYSSYNIPYSKIIVGAAFYGMKQTRTYDSFNHSWSGWVKASSPHYHTIVSSYLNNSSYQVHFDDVAKVPYILKNDGTEFISFDNHESIIAKSNYILSEKLGGMMFWESGTDKTNSLIMSLGEGLGKIK